MKMYHPIYKNYFTDGINIYCTSKITNRRYNDKIPQFNRLGYYLVSVNIKDGKYKRCKINRRDEYVHRFMFECYNGRKIKKELVINHIDEDILNNKKENLEEITQMQNVHHGSGLKRMMESIPKMQVYQIDMVTGKIIGKYKSQAEASRAIGFSQGGISNCIKGKSKSCGGFIWRGV